MHPLLLFAFCLTGALVVMMAGPLFSTYRYDFQKNGIRISVKFLDVLPTPGILVPYRQITTIKKGGAWQMSPLLILVNLFGFVLATIALVNGVGFPILFLPWGSIWKTEKSVALTFNQIALFYSFRLIDYCAMIAVTPDDPETFIARLRELSRCP